MAPVVVLVKPPEQSRFNFGTFSLGVLAAAIRDIATVHILDASAMDCSESAARILGFAPDWIGVTTMSLTSLAPVARVIAALRARDDSVRIVVGGHGASMLPAHPLAAGADLVVYGEGEATFRHLLLHGTHPPIPGIAWLDHGECRTTPAMRLIEPLDSLNPPARDLMPPPVNQVHLLETSRGCPHACRFCETTRFYGRHWRPMSPVRVARDVRDLVEVHDAWIIEITDDNFGADKTRVLRICELLREQELPAFFMVSARADDLMADTRILPAMAGARMLRISIGVESLVPNLAPITGKNIDPAVYRKLFARMRELGMFSVASFIVGLPGEPDDAGEKNLALAIEAGPDSAQFIPFYPFPGIPLAADVDGIDPDPDAVRLARQLTLSFYRDDQVRRRLEQAAAGNAIRAGLARGTMEKYATAVS